MTAIVSAKSTIHIEETQYKSAVSESTMTKIGAAINWVNENAGDIIGMVMPCYLTEAQFATLKGYDHTVSIESRRWAIMSGQNITGSDFEVLTGITTLPNMTTGSRFLRQAGDSATLGQVQSNQNLDHNHPASNFTSFKADISSGAGSAFSNIDGGGGVTITGGTLNISSNGGSEARPNSLAINYFIKINNN